MPETKLPKEIWKVIDESAKIVGRWKEEDFNQNLFRECIGLEIESPIEQVLYCALDTVREVNYIERGDPISIKGEDFVVGLGVTPQRKIGNYRVDFEVYYGHIRKNNNPITKSVIIECDSQQFHERTEKERRYEKARDRFLHSQGFKVFHYTGKEIMEDPYKVACEIIAFLTEDVAEDLYATVKEYR